MTDFKADPLKATYDRLVEIESDLVGVESDARHAADATTSTLQFVREALDQLRPMVIEGDAI